MQAHHLEVSKTARYFLSGPRDGNYNSICFALHGYGQLASYFGRNFAHPELANTLFVIPEGLSRFYLSDSSGRVGATWMTKEDRLTDIKDYVSYLDCLYEHFQTEVDNATSVGILGFSQGVATACRWLAQSYHTFHYLINWAGAFPPDLNFEAALHKLEKIPLWMVVGNEDEYISEKQFSDHLKMVKDRGFHPQTILFQGKHKIYREPLLKVMKQVI